MHAVIGGTVERSSLPRRALGATGLEVSELGFGAGSYWGKPSFPEDRAVALVRQALDAGVNLFDTGPSYSGGEAEARLGRALSGLPREDLVIATKVGTRLDDRRRPAKDFGPDSMRRSLEASLRRLGLERLPLLFLHGPSIDDLGDPTLAFLEQVRRDGLVAHVGLNSFQPAVIGRSLELDVFDCLMIDYNILRIEREPLIAAWADAGKGVLAAGALARAVVGNRLLRLRGGADLWYLARALGTRRRDLVRGRRYRFIDRVPDWTGAAVALAFVLRNPQVHAALVGTTDPDHLADNLAVPGRQLPAAVERRLRAVHERYG